MSTKEEPVTYWERWHRHAREPVVPLDSAQARRLDQEGNAYTVVLGEPQHPSCFIEVNRDCYGVSFLDDRKREHLMYTFEEVEPNKLFLKEAIYRDFDDSTDAILRGTVYRFSTNGHVSIERSEPPFHRATVTESQVEVSRNWEPKPVFGQYAGLVRKERNVS